ncbi:hypothetical protein RHGRI_037087 [Rhododendron griersonianum]|uniref:Uncharacterized protein n=1 Tax=Rhododendron griersonianum TaxID=479676 RepID=A0AAV6HU68_9ERIC|nr:hypothetical protein RHGRI_037087 [Rhododendron griersonianum]
MKPLSIITKFKTDLSYKPSPIPPTAILIANPSPIPIAHLHRRPPHPRPRCSHPCPCTLHPRRRSSGVDSNNSGRKTETPTGKPPSIASPSPPLLVAHLPMTGDNNRCFERVNETRKKKFWSLKIFGRVHVLIQSEFFLDKLFNPSS